MGKINILWQLVEIVLNFQKLSSGENLVGRCRSKYIHDVSSNFVFLSYLAHMLLIYFLQFWSVWLYHLGLILNPVEFFCAFPPWGIWELTQFLDSLDQITRNLFFQLFLCET